MRQQHRWYWRWYIDDVLCLGDMTCATAGAVKPVPDGKWVSGTAMKATKAASDGSSVNLTWDVSTCQDANYNLYYGNGSDVSTYALQGSDCGLGNSGTASGVAIPAVPSGQTLHLVGHHRNGRRADRKLVGKRLCRQRAPPGRIGPVRLHRQEPASTCP